MCKLKRWQLSRHIFLRFLLVLALQKNVWAFRLNSTLCLCKLGATIAVWWLGNLCFVTLPHLRILLLSVDKMNCLHFKEETEEQHGAAGAPHRCHSRAAVCPVSGLWSWIHSSCQTAGSSGSVFPCRSCSVLTARLWLLQMMFRLTPAQAVLLVEGRGSKPSFHWCFPIDTACS